LADEQNEIGFASNNKKAQLMLAYPRDAKTMKKNSSISKL